MATHAVHELIINEAQAPYPPSVRAQQYETAKRAWSRYRAALPEVGFCRRDTPPENAVAIVDNGLSGDARGSVAVRLGALDRSSDVYPHCLVHPDLDYRSVRDTLAPFLAPGAEPVDYHYRRVIQYERTAKQGQEEVLKAGLVYARYAPHQSLPARPAAGALVAITDEGATESVTFVNVGLTGPENSGEPAVLIAPNIPLDSPDLRRAAASLYITDLQLENAHTAHRLIRAKLRKNVSPRHRIPVAAGLAYDQAGSSPPAHRPSNPAPPLPRPPSGRGAGRSR